MHVEWEFVQEIVLIVYKYFCEIRSINKLIFFAKKNYGEDIHICAHDEVLF